MNRNKLNKIKLNSLYKNLTYFDQYGDSVILLIILIILFILFFIYFYIHIRIQPMKDNWEKYRCNPRVIPFAGFINKPNNISINEYTKKNMAFCVKNNLISTNRFSLESITPLTKNLTNVYETISKNINSTTYAITDLRNNVSTIIQDIFSRISNQNINLQQLFIGFQDSLNKMISIFTTGVYFEKTINSSNFIHS
jgi:hypothetical protein